MGPKSLKLILEKRESFAMRLFLIVIPYTPISFIPFNVLTAEEVEVVVAAVGQTPVALVVAAAGVVAGG